MPNKLVRDFMLQGLHRVNHTSGVPSERNADAGFTSRVNITESCSKRDLQSRVIKMLKWEQPSSRGRGNLFFSPFSPSLCTHVSVSLFLSLVVTRPCADGGPSQCSHSLGSQPNWSKPYNDHLVQASRWRLHTARLRDLDSWSSIWGSTLPGSLRCD